MRPVSCSIPNEQRWALCSFDVRLSNRFEIKPEPSHLEKVNSRGERKRYARRRRIFQQHAKSRPDDHGTVGACGVRVSRGCHSGMLPIGECNYPALSAE